MLIFDDFWSSNLKHNFLEKSSKNNLINQIVFFWLIYFFWFLNVWFSFDRSTHLIALRLILLLLIKIFKIDDAFVFVIELIGLLFLSIHLISIISRFLYDWQKFMTSIINHFLYVVFNFTKYSYKNLKSVQITNEMSNCNFFKCCF